MTIKIRDWRRVWSRFLNVDLRVAEYGDYKFLLEKRAGGLGRRWRLEIYIQDRICVRTSHPNLMVAKAKVEEWLNKYYGASGSTPAPATCDFSQTDSFA